MSEPRKSSLAELKARIAWGECRRCAACCRQLIVGAAPQDVLREPLIAERCPVLDGNGDIKDPVEWSWSIAVGRAQPCPFLGADNACSIYATRPEECVAFVPGGAKCAECRALDLPDPAGPSERPMSQEAYDDFFSAEQDGPGHASCWKRPGGAE